MSEPLDEAPDGVFPRAFRAFPYVAFLIETDGTVLAVNKRAQRLLGLSDDPKGEHLAQWSDLTPDGVRLRLRESIASGFATIPMRTTSPGDAAEILEFRVTMLRGTRRGEQICLLTQDHLKQTADSLSAMNLRRLSAVEELAELRAAYDDAQQHLLKATGFAYSAAHDLRTPINTLSGLVTLFEQRFGPALDPKALEYLEYMGRAVEQLTELTDVIVESARDSASAVNIETVPLQTALEDVVASVRADYDTAGADLQVSGPDLTVMADPVLLRALLRQLLSNALKYRHESRPLRVQVTVHAPDDDTPSLEVHDTGVGFDPAKADVIFLPFHRLNQTIDGTGTGLSLCAEICRRHRWRIRAHSDGQSGATVTVAFTAGGTSAKK